VLRLLRFFGAIDHCVELVGWHVAKIGDRWASSRSAVVSATSSVASRETSRAVCASPVRLGAAVTSPTPGSTR